MVIGIAPSPARWITRAVAALILGAGVNCGAGAQEAQKVAPVSPACDAPFKDIAVPEPLPRLAQAIEAGKPIKVLTIGSSSTVGIGATTPSRTYPSQLQGILTKAFADREFTFINRGVSGEQAAGAAQRIPVLVATEKPTLVLWQVGTNDALARVPVADFVETVRGAIRWVKSHNADIVLVGLQYTPASVRDEHYHAIREALRKTAEEEGVLIVRRYAAMQFLEKARGDALLTGDGLHLNDLGYRCMAEHIAHALALGAFLRVKARPNFMQ